MKINYKLNLKIMILLIFVSGCNSKKHSLGMDDEIRVVCSKLDEPIIRKYLSSIFNDTIYTPQPEPIYKLIFSKPSDFVDLKKYAHLIVSSVDRNDSNPGYRLLKQLLPKNQYDNAKNNNPMYLKRDLYAKDQVFIIINAINENHLLKDFDKNRASIIAHYKEQFNNRSNRFLFKDSQKEEEEKLKLNFGWNIKVPWGWKILKSDEKEKLFWMGAEYPYRWVSINWEDGNIINDQLKVGNVIWTSSKKHYGSIVFNDFKFHLEKIYFNNLPGWRCTGVWSSNDSLVAKGGPFQSFLFYDLKSDRTFHINTLVYNPGRNKASYIRQLEYVAKSINLEFD